MSSTPYPLTILTLFFVVLIFGGVHESWAQPVVEEPGINARHLREIIRKKQSKGSLVLLTPEDLSILKFATGQKDSAAGDPCSTAAPIEIGQTIDGELTPEDCQAPDFSYADFYRFQGQANQHLTIRLNSAAFDTYLGVTEEFGEWVREDDDGGEGTNSLLHVVLPSTGPYIVLANSVFPNEFGPYTLSVEFFVPCSYSLDPTNITAPPLGGPFNFTVNTQQGCQWGFIGAPSFATLSQYSGTGTTTVTMTVAINDTNAPREGYLNLAGNILTVTQASLACAFSIAPQGATLPGTASGGQFSVTAPDGCGWIAEGTFQYPWIQITSPPQSGNGIVNFTVSPFYGAGTRVGAIRVRGEAFTITQNGLNCTYSVSPTVITAPSWGRTTAITVNTQPGCVYSMGSSFMFQVGNGGAPFPSGPGDLTIEILPNPNVGLRGMVATLYGGGVFSVPITFRQAGTNSKTVSDFNGDRRADLSVQRQSDNIWHVLTSTSYTAMQFGVAGDKMVPADYDGDGKTDVAVFRPSTGTWFVYMSQSQTFQTFGWGQDGDIPVPTDRNADGKADLVIYRPSNNTWYTRFSNGTFHTFQFGIAGDKPMLGDFDGDGIGDVALFRPSNNNWYIIKSSLGFFVQTWGEAGDIPLTGDFDGDGATDQAVFRPSTGQWFLSKTTEGFSSQNWGQSGDVPVAADYDGDGKTDIAVFRPSNGQWYIVQSTAGILILPFGQDGDIPTQAAFIY